MIDMNICYKDRPTELALLLQSLREQTYQEFDVYILDDGSGTAMNSYHFLGCLIQRLKYEGHRVSIIRNDRSQGIVKSRQRLAEHCIEHGRGEYICRQDDDTILEKDYLEKLMEVIDAGYDLASGVTPPLLAPLTPREIKFVTPIINRVVLDAEGKFLVNCDDCGHSYQEGLILPTHHFRSSALYKKEIHEKVSYELTLTKCGFREEEFFSFRCILAGFKLGVHTQAVAWHLCAPSGGDRRQEYAEWSKENQRQLNVLVKRWYKEHGDFIKAYNDKVIPKADTKEDKFRSLDKNTNLIYHMEV